MVTAKLVNVNAWQIMSMHKIAHIMDVSKLFFFLFSIEIAVYFIHCIKKVRVILFQFAGKKITTLIHNTNMFEQTIHLYKESPRTINIIAAFFLP